MAVNRNQPAVDPRGRTVFLDRDLPASDDEIKGCLRGKGRVWCRTKEELREAGEDAAGCSLANGRINPGVGAVALKRGALVGLHAILILERIQAVVPHLRIGAEDRLLRGGGIVRPARR